MEMKASEVKTLRKKLGMTQVEFAKALVVSFATVNRWERGRCKPLPDRLEKLKKWKHGSSVTGDVAELD